MSEMPTKRQSIHPEEDLDLYQTADQELLQCEKCKKNVLVNKDGSQTKLDKNDAIQWATLQKKKFQKDIDLKNLSNSLCQGCMLPAPVAAGIVSGISVFKGLAIFFGIIGGISSIALTYQDAISYYYTRSLSIPVKMEVDSKADQMLESELFKLENLYTKQIEDTWITFTAGIKSVISENPNQPSMFLLLFDNESAGKTAKCIAQDVSKSAIKYLMGKSDTPIVVNGADLNRKTLLDDPGILLKELNGTVREKGALVVTNLHEVPTEVAKMFHFVCDKYSPLVEKAVTLFTLKVKQIPSQIGQQQTAEQTMRQLWSSAMDDNLLRPLITRMTSNIIRIYPDSSCSVF